MSLEKVATVVRSMKEDPGVRDAVAKNDEKVLHGFSDEERTALQALAGRLQKGERLPAHLKRDPNGPLESWV